MPDLFPAIDLRGGYCVRLEQGDYARETVYGADPVAVAKEYEAAGAPWAHVVDLDAARTGQPENRAAVAAVAQAVGIPVQAGGGVRDEAAATALAEAGVARVVVGTAALEDPDLVHRLAGVVPVALGLDARRPPGGGTWEVAVRGWREGSGRQLLDVLRSFEGAGLAAVVVTEIGRDGTMAGPDLDGLAQVLGATEVPVIASGGVGTLADLTALAELDADGRRLAGVIVGRALYEGAFTVEEAVAACRGGRAA